MTDEDKELVKRLREKADWLDPEIDMIEEWEALDAADRIEALSAENERLREALRFYANTPCNMEFGVVNVCPYDDGDIARAALGDTK